MDIKLKARLSAYSRFPKVSSDKPSDVPCDTEVATKEDIDALFDTVVTNSNNAPTTSSVKSCTTGVASIKDIDALFD